MLTAFRNALFHTWFRINRPMTLGVRVLAINGDGWVCLVRHTYTPGWHLPGGGVERGETCVQAAIKEVREEVGLIVAPNDMHLISIHANFENFRGDHVLVYLTHTWAQVPVDNAREIAEFGFFSTDALPDATTPGTRRRIKELRQSVPVSTRW